MFFVVCVARLKAQNLGFGFGIHPSDIGIAFKNIRSARVDHNLFARIKPFKPIGYKS
jgi:hypothetical protein